jgi:hypothetical protein
MATQNYRGRMENVPPGEDSTNPEHPVHGNQRRSELGLNTKNPTAGPVRTPSPTREYDPTAKDHTFGRASGNPGSNAWGGASSLHPGETTVDVAAVKQPDADPVLDAVLGAGVGNKSEANKRNMPLNSQLRDVSDKPFEPAHGMRRRQQDMADWGTSNERVPSKTGDSGGSLPSTNQYGARDGNR